MMNWTAQLSKRLIYAKSQRENATFSVAKLNQWAIALSVATMLLASFCIRGFETEIESKIYNFWANVHILPFSATNNFLDNPIEINNENQKYLHQNKEIKSMHFVANKGVILRHKNQMEGLILKGLDSQMLSNLTSHSFAQSHWDTGFIPLWVSKNTAKSMQLSEDKTLYVSYLQGENTETQKAKVAGIYHTGISEFDAQNALTTLPNVQKLNNWQSDQYSSAELFVSNPKDIQRISGEIYKNIEHLNVMSVYEIFPQMFDWLKLMAQNEWIIIIIMLLVSMMNIVSSMSIFILERTQLIGLLKALGASNRALYRLFIHQIFKILTQGIFWGNLIAFALGIIQYFFHLIRLNEEVYYTDFAPIYFDWAHIIGINLLSILVCFSAALIPLYFITKISPIKIAEYK